jgi:hypothetical protein
MSHPAALGLVLLLAGPAAAGVHVEPAAVRLDGPDARYSLLVDVRSADGARVDQTRRARYRSANPGVARVSSRGEVTAVGDGKTTIVVSLDGQTQSVSVEVRNASRPRTYHFGNDIVPLLSRFACNSSGCHGKAEGQNGFKLSVFGFDPAADHASLVMEGRGRRLLPAAPEASLLVRKMAGLTPHGGGARIRPGSPAYATIVGWVAAGAPYGTEDAPTVTAVRVEPPEAVLAPRGTQQLRVLARYSDGSERDVTSRARFQSNNDALAGVDAEGQVTAGRVPGEAAVMASFMNVFGLTRVLAPRQQKIRPYPGVKEHNFIDRHVHARLRKLNIVPSDVCDDATYLRRVFLDVIGVLPTPAETRAFLADRSADRRGKVVGRLLGRPEFADYWAMKWADLLRVDRAALGAKHARAYHGWIRRQIAAGVHLDQTARAVLTAEGPLAESPQGSFYRAVGKPGERASTLAQVFLGVRIACAECHHHPFDRWTQADYQGLAAYFAGVRIDSLGEGPSAAQAVSVAGRAEARHPRTGAVILAHPLGEKAPDGVAPGDRREELARWLTSPQNPYFARNIANRVWAHLLGRGLIDPVDDVRATNPPSNPDLLDALAKHLTDAKYDLRSLIRAITASRTYQLATTPNATNAGDSINYSRAALRRLPAEVLLDMICQCTGVPERFRGAPPHTRAVQLWDSKTPHYFLRAFGRPERTTACECQRNSEPSVAQVLHLLNAPEIEGKLSHAGGRIARLVQKSGDDKLLEELYLTFFSRPPSDKERRAGLAHLKANAPQRQSAAEDLAWGMINSLEFLFNH